MSNFDGNLLLPYKFPRPVDCKLPTTGLMYDTRYNKRSICLRMYCHNISFVTESTRSDICKCEVGINEKID
jgi:hypothetical protein